MLLELDCKQGGFERNPEIQITTIKYINVVSWILDIVIPRKRAIINHPLLKNLHGCIVYYRISNFTSKRSIQVTIYDNIPSSI